MLQLQPRGRAHQSHRPAPTAVQAPAANLNTSAQMSLAARRSYDNRIIDPVGSRIL